MKITIPEYQKEIKLGQFQEYELSKKEDMTDSEHIDIMLTNIIGIAEEEVGFIPQNDREEIAIQVLKCLAEEGEFYQSFVMNGIEFGLIPNFKKDKVTGKEYGDMALYIGRVDYLHNLMAILYRPIVNKDKYGNYSIEPYDGTSEYAEIMKQMPLDVVNGILGFFLNLYNVLEPYTESFMKQE